MTYIDPNCAPDDVLNPPAKLRGGKDIRHDELISAIGALTAEVSRSVNASNRLHHSLASRLDRIANVLDAPTYTRAPLQAVVRLADAKTMTGEVTGISYDGPTIAMLEVDRRPVDMSCVDSIVLNDPETQMIAVAASDGRASGWLPHAEATRSLN